MNTLLTDTKDSLLEVLGSLVRSNIINSSELKRYIIEDGNPYDPETIRSDLESWYKNLGIEGIIGRTFTLSPCPFTRDEIQEATENNYVILCVPQNISRQELGKLFRIDSWALHDPLATSSTEIEDFWFKTSMSLSPGCLKKTGVEICHQFEDEGKAHFSLERYLVFIARIRHLLKVTPDSEYWVWIPHGRYDRSGMLIAGFDRFGNFNVHGWMPQFSASFLGARHCIGPNPILSKEGANHD